MAIWCSYILASAPIPFHTRTSRQKPGTATGALTKSASPTTISRCMRFCSKAEADGWLNRATSWFIGNRSSLLPLFDFCSEAAAVELDGYGVADGDLRGVAEDDAVGVGGDGVAAFEDFQGTAFFELQAEALQAVALEPQLAFGANAEIGGAFFQAQTQRGNLHAKIEGTNAELREREAFARCVETLGKPASQAAGEVIGALALLAEQIERAAKTAAAGEFMHAPAEDKDAVAHLLGEGAAEIGDVLIEFAARLHDDFRGGGRRGSANVGDEIGDGEIGFVANAGDNGDARIENCAGDDFFVERPKIFERTSAARKNEHVREILLVEKFQGFDDFARGFFSLDAHGIERYADIVEAAAEDAHNVANRGPFGRSDQTDAAGKQGQRFFVPGIEEAFGFEAPLELIESELQSAEAERLHRVDVNLILTPLLVHTEAAAHGDFEAVFGMEAHAEALLLEPDAANLRAVILKSAVDVAGLSFAAVGDFAFDENVREIAAKEIADARSQLGDGKGAALGLEVELELSGHGEPTIDRRQPEKKGAETGAMLSGFPCGR